MKVSEELRKIIDKAATITFESLESAVQIARESGVPEQDILHKHLNGGKLIMKKATLKLLVKDKINNFINVFSNKDKDYIRGYEAASKIYETKIRELKENFEKEIKELQIKFKEYNDICDQYENYIKELESKCNQ